MWSQHVAASFSIVLWLTLLQYAICNSIVGRTTSNDFPPIKSFHSLHEKIDESGFSMLHPQKKSSQSKRNRDLIAGELLVSIPMKVILSSLKDNPFQNQRKQYQQGSRKSSTLSPNYSSSSPHRQLTYSPSSPPSIIPSSIDDILADIGMDHYSLYCKRKFLCTLLEDPISYRPLSDIIVFSLSTTRGKRDQGVKEMFCSSFQVAQEPCSETPRLNTRFLKLWQWLANNYNLNISS